MLSLQMPYISLSFVGFRFTDHHPFFIAFYYRDAVSAVYTDEYIVEIAKMTGSSEIYELQFFINFS